MRVNRLILIVLSALLVVSFACSPQVSPAPAPPANPPTQAPTPATTPTSNIPSTSSQDSDWDKIVQAAKKEGKVTYYSYAATGDIGIAIADAFEKTYGIKLENITGPGVGFIERLKTEKRMGQMVADVFQAAVANVLMAKEQGMTVSARGVPVFDEKDVWKLHPFSFDKDGHLAILSYSEYSPYVNTKLVKREDDPKSWQDFLQPIWKGRLLLPDPISNSFVTVVAVGLLDNKAIDEKWLKQIGSYLILTSNPRDALSKLSRGDAPIALWGTVVDAGIFVADGAPIRRLKMNEGLLVGATPLALINGAPHPNAAKLFVNWLMSKEGQTVYNRAMSATSNRNDVQDFIPEAMRIGATKISVISAEEIDRAAKLFQEKWLVEMWKK